MLEDAEELEPFDDIEDDSTGSFWSRCWNRSRAVRD